LPGEFLNELASIDQGLELFLGAGGRAWQVTAVVTKGAKEIASRTVSITAR